MIFDDMCFVQLAGKRYSFTQPTTAEGVINRALSTSFISALPKDDQDTIRNKITSIITQSEPRVTNGAIEFPYLTELYLFRKR